MKAAYGKELTTRKIVLEATMYGRTTLRVYTHVRPGGSISSGEAIEILPDGSEQQRLILCYERDIKKVSSLLRRMAREHRHAAEALALIDGEYWLRELAKCIDPGCVFADRRSARSMS